MIKKYFFVPILFVMLCLTACGNINEKGDIQMTSIKNESVQPNDNIEKLTEKYEIGNNIVPKFDIVKDKETAIKLAEDILLPIYGNEINDKKPFEATYDEEFKAWVVSGTLGKNFIGGVPNVIIQKSDGKVLAVWHTK
ncbi:NTF2 fold immunity protein [Pseudobacteroides cellulosolvens]|nr:NTF2 fold immunity protein [Pseudobacteroides cellulosolvens]HOV28392.1 NTF2 fold immunity protein [Pseudobacteroides sp.]